MRCLILTCVLCDRCERPHRYAFVLRIANIEVQIAKLDSEAWPGLLDPERDRLILINEKEELLKELQYVSPRQRLEPNDAEKLETEKKRLERDLQAARDNQSKALTERWDNKHMKSPNNVPRIITGRKHDEENASVAV